MCYQFGVFPEWWSITYRFNEIIIHFYIAGLYISNCVRKKQNIFYIYKTIHHDHKDTCKIYLLYIMYRYKFYILAVVFNEWNAAIKTDISLHVLWISKSRIYAPAITLLFLKTIIIIIYRTKGLYSKIFRIISNYNANLPNHHKDTGKKFVITFT